MTKPEPVAWAIFRNGELDWEHDQPFSDEPQSMMDDEESRPLYGWDALADVHRAALEEAAKIAVRLASANHSKCCEMRSLRIADEIRALIKESSDDSTRSI